MRRLLVLVLCCLLPAIGFAQKKDSANTTFVDLSADNVFGYKTDSGDVSKFIGNAVFHQGTDTLYCDSLYQYKATNIIEAFSNVRIIQAGGTQGKSDYLKYLSGQKLAYMHGNVSLTDGKNDLQTEDLTYDLGTKIGHYENGGILHNDSTNVTSRSGIYNVATKMVRFTGNAVIIDPEYKIHSEDLEYHTETKVTQFFAKSTVESDSGKSILQTKNGTYDGKRGIAHFIGHSSIWNDGEYIEGDSLDYNKLTGYGLGNGHVIAIDTAHHSTLYCGHAEYFHKSRVLWASIKPVMEQVNGVDTFYLRADTFYTAPMVKMKLEKAKPKVKVKKKDDDEVIDSAAAIAAIKAENRRIKRKEDSIAASKIVIDTAAMLRYAVPVDTLRFPRYRKDTAKQKKIAVTDSLTKPAPDFVWVVPTGPKYRKLDTSAQHVTMSTEIKPVVKKTKMKGGKGVIAVADTATADTTAPMFFIAWNHVRLFSDSMQGKCDSMVYTRYDSTIRMINDPIAWAHSSQITGDTILMILDSNALKSVYVPNNALVISQSGPEKAELFDQVQGKTLTAYFKGNAITHMLVEPDAEFIYYAKDEHDAYMGVDQGSSVRMLIYFEDQKISNLKLHQDVHQVNTPMDKLDIPNTRLSRFKWMPELRPKTKEELFD
ncbi:MAG: hypothetical protein JWQ38_1068 [Flavipsychrobacter sp.]|nr:hypothetical protein [Flavipsychrobacter sp.]